MAKARRTSVALPGAVRINSEKAASSNAEVEASSDSTMKSGKAISASSLTGQTSTSKGTTLRATSTNNVDRTQEGPSSRMRTGKRLSSVAADLKATKDKAGVDSISVHSRVRTRAIIQVTNSSSTRTLAIKVEEEAEVDTKVGEEASQAVRSRVMLWCQLANLTK